MRASVLRLTALAAVAAALVFAVTACGSSKDSSSSASGDTTTTATDTTTTSTDTTTTSTDTSGTDTTSSTDTTTVSSSDSGTDTSGDISKSCVNFASAASKLGQALGSTGSASADSESLKKYFEGLAAKAPGDIKGAFQTLAAAIAKYVDGIKGLNLKPGETPSTADLAKMQNAAAAMSTADVRAASTKVSAWVKAGCHS